MGVHAKDFYYQAAQGVRGTSAVVKFGSNLDIDTGSDPETIWSTGGLYDFPLTAAQLSITSTSANDTADGTGARTLVIQGVDEDYKEIEEEITLNGLTPVLSTSNKWLRVYRMFVSSAGSGEVNAGSIATAVGSADGAIILAGDGQTQMAVYTVPAGKTAYLKTFSAALTRSSSSAIASLGLYIRKNGVRRLLQEISVGTQGSNTYNKEYIIPIKIEEKTDIYVECIEVSNNNSSVFSNFSLVLE